MMFKLQATSYKLRAKRSQRLKVRLISLLVYGLWPMALISPLYAQTATLNDILSFPDRFDGKIVKIQGEVIGDALKEKEGMWINILSKGNRIGVFVSNKTILRKLRHWGSYKEQGDYISIKGIFHKNCPVHQQRDIHAKNIDILKEGFLKRENIAPFKTKLVISFFIISLTLTAVYFIKLYKYPH